MALFESGEMYLETILILSKKGKIVRAIDIGDYMGFSKPSVSRALARLKADGYITVHPDEGISFTEKGRSVAETIYERHNVLSEYLMLIGVGEDTAKEDACRIEHVISDESFQAIKSHVQRFSGNLPKA